MTKKPTQIVLVKFSFPIILHIFVLCSFAIAQPLYDILGKKGEYFLSHDAFQIDIILFACILSVLIPLSLGLLCFVACLIHRNLFVSIYLVIIGVLFFVIFTMIGKKIFPFNVFFIFGFSFCLSGALTWIYLKKIFFRKFLTFASPSVLIFLILFFSSTPIAKLVGFDIANISAILGKGPRPPIVFLIFDELSTLSLVDEHLKIDDSHFPNFAALAEKSTWFRDATLVNSETTRAIPSIVTGTYPRADKLPISSDYPDNLLSYLQNDYEMSVYEFATSIYRTRNMDNIPPISSRLVNLMIDTSVIYAHVVLPAALRENLPPITQNWSKFVDLSKIRKESRRERVGSFRDLIATISRSEQPHFYFWHINLPHVPYYLMPSTNRYGPYKINELNLAKERWGKNKWFVLHGWQRHLIQTMAVDKLLGELLNKLKLEGIYESTLLIVTADHGVAFWPEESRRSISQSNHPFDILSIPLFIKTPNQTSGKILDINAQAIDIVPTVADILDLELPWKTAGYSLFDKNRPIQTEITPTDGMTWETLKLISSLEPLRKSALIKKKYFPPDSDFIRPKGLQILPDLTDKELMELNVLQKYPSKLKLTLDKGWFDLSKKSETIVWTRISGILTGLINMQNYSLGVAFDEKIYSTAPIYRVSESEFRCSVMIPESIVIRDLENDIKLFLIKQQPDGASILERIRIINRS